MMSFELVSAGLSRDWGRKCRGEWLHAAGHRQLPQHRGALVAAEASRVQLAWALERMKVTVANAGQLKLLPCPALSRTDVISGRSSMPHWQGMKLDQDCFLLAGARSLYAGWQ